MNPLTSDVNETTTFLLPILFPEFTHDQIFSDYFEEAYIGLMDEDTYDDMIIFKYSEDPKEELQTDLESVKIEDNIIGYHIPKELSEEYEKFLSGSYSKFSEKSKRNILDFWGKDEDSGLYGILYKTDIGKSLFLSKVKTPLKNKLSKNLKNQEFWPPPDILLNELLQGEML